MGTITIMIMIMIVIADMGAVVDVDTIIMEDIIMVMEDIAIIVVEVDDTAQKVSMDIETVTGEINYEKNKKVKLFMNFN